MKIKITLTALATLAALLVAVPSLLATNTQTLQGEFVWERSDKSISGDLEAVFEPTGDATWNVSFHFTFDEKDHVYSGTAEGSLTEGELLGHVMTDGEEPSPFEFKGTFADGSFTGTHMGFRDGEAEPTGTMTLSR
jgi:hypothetical protein